MVAVERATINDGTISIQLAASEAEAARLRLRTKSEPEGLPPIEDIIAPTSITSLAADRQLVAFATPDVRPLVSAMPAIDDGSGGLTGLALDTVPGFALDNLLPRDSRDLSRLIFHRSSRIKDRDTLAFVLDQVFRSPRNDYFERIEAAKILAYQALEEVDLIGLAPALDRIEAAMDWVVHLPHDYGIAKTSRYQSRISLLYLRYLLNLFLSRATAMDAALEQIAAATDHVRECPIAAYNLCLALLARGFVQSRRNDPAGARASWELVIDLFRQAAVAMPAKTPSTFVELTVSFEAAKQAAWAIAAMAGKRIPPSTELTAEKLAVEFSRLRSPASRSIFARQIEAIAISTGVRAAS